MTFLILAGLDQLMAREWGHGPIDMTCKLPGDRASADVLGHILFGLGSLGVFLSSKSLHQGTLQ